MAQILYWKDWPVWLKGGLLGAAVPIVILILSILGIILRKLNIAFTGNTDDLLYMYLFSYYSSLSIPFTFLLGVIIALVIKHTKTQKGNETFNGWKVGFWIACAFMVIYMIDIILSPVLRSDSLLDALGDFLFSSRVGVIGVFDIFALICVLIGFIFLIKRSISKK